MVHCLCAEKMDERYDIQNNIDTNTLDSQNIFGWNWGAFALAPFWSIGNKVYIGLITLIPIIGFIWSFVCGAKGNEWAWDKGEYENCAEFSYVQRTWNKAGKIWFIVQLASFIFGTALIVFITSLLLYMGMKIHY